MLDAPPHPPDDDACMREILRQAFWTLAYYEDALPKAHRKMALRRALLEHAGLAMELHQAREICNGSEDEDDYRFKNVREYAAWLLAEVADSIQHHETELARAHTKLAHAKALMRRANLDLPLNAIETAARQRVADA